MINNIKNKLNRLSITGKILYLTGAVKELQVEPYLNIVLRKYHPATVTLFGVSFIIELLISILQ